MEIFNSTIAFPILGEWVPRNQMKKGERMSASFNKIIQLPIIMLNLKKTSSSSIIFHQELMRS
jgi:hypothetical protein